MEGAQKEIKLKAGEMSKEMVIEYQLDYMSINEFKAKYHPDKHFSTINYWINHGYINWFRPGGSQRLVVITYLSQNFDPALVGYQKRT